MNWLNKYQEYTKKESKMSMEIILNNLFMLIIYIRNIIYKSA